MAYPALFYAVAGLTLLGAAGVAFSRNIIYSAFSLLATFFGVALVYALLSSDFLAVAQLLLYVGGILVLIMFAVMLTNRIGETSGSNTALTRLEGCLACGSLLVLLLLTVLLSPWLTAAGEPCFEPVTRKIGDALLGPYLLPFEIVSVLLLVGLVGAVVVARKGPAEEK